jgi:disulfide bond formation protein DsbB
MMTENALPKAIVIAGAMIAIATGASHFGAAGFVWMLLGVGAGGFLAWREFWGGELPGKTPAEGEDAVADRFR